VKLDARLETVRARHLGISSCQASAGRRSGCPMAAAASVNATAPRRPRCTAWSSSNWSASPPTSMPVLAPNCRCLSRTNSTPSPGAASWRTAF